MTYAKLWLPCLLATAVLSTASHTDLLLDGEDLLSDWEELETDASQQRATSERLLVLKELLRDPRADSESIVQAIKLTHPQVQVSQQSVERTIGSVLLTAIVPKWFHDAVVTRGADVEPSDPSLIADLMVLGSDPRNLPFQPELYTKPFVIEFLLRTWVRQCVFPMLTFPQGPEPCVESVENFFGQPAPAWRLRTSQLRVLIGQFIIQEEENLLGHPIPSPDFDDIFPLPV
jgi:hypothetical protein